MIAVLTANANVISDAIAGTIRRDQALAGDGLGGPDVLSAASLNGAGGSIGGWTAYNTAAITAPAETQIGPSYSYCLRAAFAAANDLVLAQCANVQPDLALAGSLLVYLEGGGSASIALQLYNSTQSVQLSTQTLTVTGDVLTVPFSYSSATLAGETAPWIGLRLISSSAANVRFVLSKLRPPGDSSIYVGQAVTNLMANGGFESNTTGWANDGTAVTLSRVTTRWKFGTNATSGACLSMAFTGSGGYAVNRTCALAGATTGVQRAFGTWIMGTGTAIGKTAEIDLYEAGGASGAANSTATAVLTGNWQFLLVSRTIVANDRTQVQTLITLRSAANGDQLYVDGVQVEAGLLSTPYAGDSATRPAGRLQALSYLLGANQGWAVFGLRIACSAATMTASGIFFRVFDWADGSSNNRLLLGYNPGTSKWQLIRNAGGVSSGGDIGAVQSFAAGTALMLAISWTTTTLSLSINGGASATLAVASLSPSGLAATFDIGANFAGASQLGASFYWAALGTGVSSNAAIAGLYNSGSFTPDPDRDTINRLYPGIGCTAVIPMTDLNILDMAPDATGNWSLAPLWTGVASMEPAV